MSHIRLQHYNCPIGELVMGSYQQQLCLLDFRYRNMRRRVDRRIQQGLGAEFVSGDCPVLAQARQQLDEYLSGQRTEFDLPLKLVGTPFQQAVWRLLQQIPYGSTDTYAALAARLGRPEAIRAVASANAANALALIVPCHRIIGSRGELVGYGGGLAVKKRLLALESQAAQGRLF